jgi:hypothetical protein
MAVFGVFYSISLRELALFISERYGRVFSERVFKHVLYVLWGSD